jgi:pimeloyl-ACP methyl ester carboxylesterase
MKKKMVLGIGVFLAIFLCTLWTFPAKVHAEAYQISFVSVATGAGPGLLYQPVVLGEKSHIGILLMHPSANYLSHPATSQLAMRGYTVLAVNSTYSHDDLVNFDGLLLQVRNAIKYLRTVSGVTKVVLLGHSGGGPTMAAYQSIAQNGVGACRGQEKIVECPDSLAGMPAAEGLILLDTVLGMGAQVLVTLDPAVVTETSGTLLLSWLDMYNLQNGFHPPTGGTYSTTFVQRFAARQRKRMAKLVQTALDRLEKINANGGRFTDDEPFDVPGGTITAPQIWSLDTQLWKQTRNAHPLVKPDGSVVTQIVPSLRNPSTVTSSPTLTTGGARFTTVRRFLNSWACRATEQYGYGEDFIAGIDWQSTYNNTPGSVEGVTVPTLVVGMSASSLVVSNETAFDHAVSSDKTIAYIEGATHMTSPIRPEFGDTVKATFDYLDSWLSKPGRFQ